MALALSGCAALDRVGHADAIAEASGLVRVEIPAGHFLLTGYARVTDKRKPVDVYIEGDGLAWLTRTQPSLDPTPVQATGLALAAADPAPNVVYLARPCQFTPMEKNPRCEVAYWTGRRFAPEVVDSMDSALDWVAAQAPGQRLNVTGYSGGAAVAVLAAARRTDVATLRTVAGNLDDEFINRIHGVDSMPDSLNPISAARLVAQIPQIHFSSDADEVVPPEVARRFVSATQGRCATAIAESGLPHDGDWQNRWLELLAIHPTCVEP
ncbi:alpha/beta hydrolase [Paraburkholderia youngii]|uniref:alpha/beta hydrolase n=1 Tax=Paraburkholderia youngii TaxID=2782701 RepID=UPI003D1ACD9C